MPLDPSERARLHEWLGALRDGIIEDSQFDELEASLRRNPEAMRYYVDYVTLCVELRKYRATDLTQVCAEPSSEELLSEVLEQERMAAVRRAATASRELAECESSARERLEHFAPRDEEIVPVRHIVIPRIAVFAAMAASVALLLALIMPTPKAEEGPPTVAKPIPREAQSAFTLHDTSSAVWDVSGRPGGTFEGDERRLAVRRYELTSGLVELHSRRGASVVIEGPATFETTEDEMLRLNAGKLVGLCPTERSRGFRVLTPTIALTDLGTEFGVAVDESGETRVHVYSGAVALSGKATSDPLVLTTGDSRLIDARGTVHVLDDVAGEFVRTLDPAAQYVQMILDAKPIIYYNLDEIVFGQAFNQAGDRYHATVQGNVSVVDDKGIRAFAFGAGPAMLEMRQPIVELSGAASYTIECWVYTEHRRRGTLINLRPVVQHRNQNWAAFHLELIDEDRTRRGVRMLHRNPPDKAGGTDCVSSTSHPLRRWIHIAATKQDRYMTLYIDGEVVAVAEDATMLPEMPLLLSAGVNLVEGGDPGQVRQFLGSLDEVAVYDRALGEDEILHRVERGRTLLGR